MDYAKHRIPAARKMHDAFLLYREGETLVGEINDWLVSHDISTHYFNNDVALGEVIDEQSKLTGSSTVVVFLGNLGWGPSQLQLLMLAMDRRIPILPVLIGEPSDADKSKVNGLFIEKRYLDLTTVVPLKLEQLRRQILQNLRTRGIDVESLLRCLIEGNEDDRQRALEDVQIANSDDRAILGKRLRAMLDTDENGKWLNEASHRVAVRYESYQSWLCSALIWADPEHRASRSILGALMNETARTNSSLRFWILAGAYHARISYLPDLAREAFDDPAPEIRLLAEAVIGADSPAVLGRLMLALHGPSMQEIWSALRVLRVVPLVSAASRLCELLVEIDGEMPLAYDLFCALSTPPMAAAAAPRLASSPGVRHMVELMLRVLVESERYNIKRFAVLARAFEQSTITAILRDYVSSPAFRPLVLSLIDELANAGPRRGDAMVPVAGYISDMVQGQRDQLDIQTEVTVLTAIMLAKDVSPPLAIGLFGRWGSGKSFFMREMQQTADRLADHARIDGAQQFCKNIVQINFNAWHYVDTNLWASLASCILDQLAGHIFGPKMSVPARHAALVSELTTTKAAQQAVEEEKARVDSQLREAEEALQVIQQTKDAAKIKLSSLKIGDFIELATTDPQLRQGAEDAMKSLGVPAAVDSYAALDAAAQQARSTAVRAGALLMELAKKPSSAGIALTGFILLLPLFGFWLVNFADREHETLVVIGAVVAQLVGVVGAVTHKVGNAVRIVSEKIDIVENAHVKAQEYLRRKRAETSTEEAKLKADIEQARVRELEAKERLSIAAARVAEVEAQLRDLEEKSSLGWFLNERLKADDYRKHFGLIATIRADFQALVERLAQQDEMPLPDGHTPVERIILYVDDLDRCPATKVVEVLQAVHLLLAYPLFVVVVGVDAHWLIESLKTHHRAMGSIGGQNDGDHSVNEWSATPQLYLEKIFQIPFALRPMDQPGYERLMRQLMTSHSESGDDTIVVRPQDGESTRDDDTYYHLSGGMLDETTPSAMSNESASPPAVHDDRRDKTLILSGGYDVELAAAPTVIESRALSLQPNEVAFAGTLFEFIASPRAAKRLSNTYRVLKARVSAERLPIFEGSNVRTGEFEVPMLLLAILIDNAQAAKVWFPVLVANAGRYVNATDVLTDTALFAPPHPSVIAEIEKVGRVVKQARFDHRSELLVEWIPHVLRFSFDAT